MGKNWAYSQMAILIGTTMINQWMEWGTLFSDKPKFVREGDTLVLLAAGVKSFYHLLALALPHHISSNPMKRARGRRFPKDI